MTAMATAERAGILVLAAALAVLSGCRTRARPGVLDAAGEGATRLYMLEQGRHGADDAPDRFDRLAAAGRRREEADVRAGIARPGNAPAGFLTPLAREGPRVGVTLEDCLRRALAHNLTIQIARFGPAVRSAGVREAEALFDPSWFMNNAVSRIRRDAGTALAGAATLTAKQWDFASGVAALLPTGGTVRLAQDWTFLDSNSAFIMPNPQYDSELVLEIAQPLLRDAGPFVTRSPIVLARLDHTISLADFETALLDTLLEVERTYWQLVVAETRVRAVREAVEAAEENLRIARLRHREGKDPRVIVSLAESAVTSRQADLLVAELDLARTSDRLKRLLNDPELPLDDPSILRAAEQPLHTPLPVDRALLHESMRTAMMKRPELARADAAIEQAAVRERVARNGLLPRLDLVGSYGLNGLDNQLGNALDEGFGTEFFDWLVGVEFEVPLGNRARASAYDRARLQQAEATRRHEDTRQAILLEISEAVRNLAAAEETIRATRAAREAAEQTLRDQQANVTAGAALVKDLLEAQRDLADAKVREMEALAGYMTALASLQRAQGTLLAYNHIRLVEEKP